MICEEQGKLLCLVNLNASANSNESASMPASVPHPDTAEDQISRLMPEMRMTA